MTTAPDRFSPDRNGDLRRAACGPMPRVTPMTADRDRGAANLATVPRAGNVSSDTRAGKRRRSGS
jgi:hypothetical protein